mgnify:CR=1 FL=1
MWRFIFGLIVGIIICNVSWIEFVDFLNKMIEIVRG